MTPFPATERQNSAWTRADTAAAAAVLLAAVIATAQIWRPGLPSPIDFIPALYRAFELERSITGGLLFPRIGTYLNFTYGAPLFEYYAPLASYAIAAAHAIGLGNVEAAKGVVALSLAAGGLAAYGYCRWLFNSRLAALVSSLVYVFSPYYLLNVYERGAIAESVALAYLPLGFWCFHRLLVTGGRRWLLGAAMSLAGLILGHNIVGLFAFAFLACFLAAAGWASGTVRGLARAGGAATLGLALCAFYWVPALAERSFSVVDTTLATGHMDVFNHLAPLSGLVQTGLAFDYWNAPRFSLGLWPALLGLLACAVTPFQRPPLRRLLMVMALACVLMLAVQLDAAGWFWQSVPLVRYIQYPWRLNGLISFGVAVLGGSLVLAPCLKGRVKAMVALSLIVGCAATSLWGVSPDLSPHWYLFSSAEIGPSDANFRSGLGFPVDADFMPAWTRVASKDLGSSRQAGSPASVPLAAPPPVQVTEETLTSLNLHVRAASPFTLQLHKLYFPGWQASAGAQDVAVRPSGELGLVSVDLPAGEYLASVWFGETPLRTAADGVSLAAAAMFLALVLTPITRRRSWTLLLGVALAGLAVVGASTLPTTVARRPVTVSADLGGEVRLIGFDPGSLSGRPGGTLSVRLYWLAVRAPSADYKVFLHLVRLGDPAQVAQSDSEPVAGYGHTTNWQPGELVADDHEVTLPVDLLPGRYQLVTGMYRQDTVQNLPVTDAAASLPGGRIVLGEVTVTRE